MVGNTIKSAFGWISETRNRWYQTSMRTKRFLKYLRILISAGPCFLPILQAAQPVPSSGVVSLLELPRVKRHGKLTLPQLKKEKVTIDDLSTEGANGVTSVTGAPDTNLKYLAVEPGKELSRALRGSPGDIIFVSFFAYASAGTTIDIGGARLTLQNSSKAGYARLLLGDPLSPVASAHELGDTIKVERHGGASLIPLPILTIRLDPAAGSWDVFMFNQLLATDLPIMPAAGTGRKLALRAGNEGAWLLGLVSADDNPLAQDANANGIDDKFEQQKRGGLLAETASRVDRTQLAQEWKESQRANRIVGWNVRRPIPATP